MQHVVSRSWKLLYVAASGADTKRGHTKRGLTEVSMHSPPCCPALLRLNMRHCVHLSMPSLRPNDAIRMLVQFFCYFFVFFVFCSIFRQPSSGRALKLTSRAARLRLRGPTVGAREEMRDNGGDTRRSRARAGWEAHIWKLAFLFFSEEATSAPRTCKDRQAPSASLEPLIMSCICFCPLSNSPQRARGAWSAWWCDDVAAELC